MISDIRFYPVIRILLYIHFLYTGFRNNRIESDIG